MSRLPKSVYRRRRLTFFGTTAAIFTLVGGGTIIGLAPLPPAIVTTTSTTDLTSQPAQLDIPPFGTTVIEADGFGILASSNIDTPAPIASMAKLVTALVVLDAHPIDAGTSGPNISFDSSDIEVLARSIANDESRADVVEGMTLSEREVITVMLVKSANNYSFSLARWAFGSEKAYVEAANAWLRENGFGSTVVTDASGLSPETRSTPRDLLGIGALALDNEVTSSAVATVSTSIDPIGLIENSNKLLGTLGVNGIKTGTTDEAGACLLFSTVLPIGDLEVRIIGVTLGAPTHPELDEALARLLVSVQAGFHQVTPTSSGQVLATATSTWGESTNLIARDTISRLVWSDTPVRVRNTETVPATGSAGSLAGEALVTIGSETTLVPLTRESEISDPGFAWRVSHIDALFGH
jgi:D-alanyl-D-alanine carboxypeptidase (penicillin-binding protein 5/6)